MLFRSGGVAAADGGEVDGEGQAVDVPVRCDADVWVLRHGGRPVPVPGREVQFLGVDELTQWPERWYRYLLSRLRRGASSDVPLRARSASNPGGVGHAWVHERFVGPRAVGVFVPAKLEDNPHLDRGAYEEALGRLEIGRAHV